MHVVQLAIKSGEQPLRITSALLPTPSQNNFHGQNPAQLRLGTGVFRVALELPQRRRLIRNLQIHGMVATFPATIIEACSMNVSRLSAIAAVSVCLTVLMLPDQRSDAALRGVFAERGLELISIAPSTGCYRVGSYRYVVRNQSGKIESGLLCINKSLHVFEMRRRPN